MVAQNNPDSLRAALLNVAATGLSLNPVKKQAYLILRNKPWCWTSATWGFCMSPRCLARSNGARFRIVESAHVPADGINQAPVHEYNPFENDDSAGAIVGAYAVVKLPSGD